MINDLKTVVDALRSNPETIKTGIKAGHYSVAYGKIWRGSVVIGYLPASAETVEGATPPEILYTSHTSPEEAAIFRSPAPPTPAAAPGMTLTSPEGRQSEEPSTPQKQQPEQPPPAEPAPAPGAEAQPQPQEQTGEKPASEEEGAVFKRGRKESIDVAGLGAPRGADFYPEAYAVLNEARMTETRRKLLKANAVIEFDLECKKVTRGVWVHLWLLPSRRLDGKFELYTHTVTSTCNVPSIYSIKRDLVSAMHDQMPHIVVSDASVQAIARKINLAMSAAKDSLGGSQKEESIIEEIDGYLVEG